MNKLPEKTLTREDNSTIPSSVPDLKPPQLRTCSSDRKRFMVLQLYGRSLNHSRNGTEVYPIRPWGSVLLTTPSFISTRMGDPQSKQRVLMVTVFPLKSQLTASDSNPHCPNHFCCPSIVIRCWVGRLLKGAKETM